MTGRLQKALSHAQRRRAQVPLRRLEPVRLPHATVRRLGSSSVHELIGAYEAGATTPELALRYGVSRTAVKELLHRSGVAVRRPPGLGEPDVDEAVRLYEAGWLLREIAVECDVHQETVRRALLKRGVSMRSGHGDHGGSQR